MLKFDDELPATSNRPIPTGAAAAGPCAMGPVPDGETIAAMHVWIFQDTPTGVAVASGDTREEQPSTEPHRWRVRTGLDPQSTEFLTDKPAVAMAMALVRRGGDEQVQHWSQAVFISRERADSGD
jgi:hypothetical protein